jgi:hypothetical protein
MRPESMYLEVNIVKPVIIVRPNPQSEEYLAIDLGNINVCNDRYKSGERVVSSNKLS